MITSSDNKFILEKNSNSTSQNWKIEGVERDYEGYFLYYKISSESDSSKCLTYSEKSGFSLSEYSGNIYQKFKLNLEGLEGFAANCITSSGEKAGTIGGLLGPVVFVSTFDELLIECNSIGPQTIVLYANIDLKAKGNNRIRDYKSLDAHINII